MDVSVNDLFQGVELGIGNWANLSEASYQNSPLPHGHLASRRSEILPCRTPLFKWIVLF